MSSKAYEAALDFMPGEAKKPGLYARFKEYTSALSAGLAAWREYERLRMSGVEHSKAAAKAFEKHFE
ncbi:MAG: hypothetical protein ACK4TL_01970 [Hyphomicrobiaceae bacterium]